MDNPGQSKTEEITDSLSQEQLISRIINKLKWIHGEEIGPILLNIPGGEAKCARRYWIGTLIKQIQSTISSIEAIPIKRNTMVEDIQKKWPSGGVPTKVYNALINSPYHSLDDVAAIFNQDVRGASIEFLRLPNCGRSTVNQLINLLGLDHHPTQSLSTTRDYFIPEGVKLTDEDVQVIRKLIRGFELITEEGDFADKIKALKNKITRTK